MNQKKKISRKVISYVLALVMVFSTLTGIVPGTGITAYAASTELTAETTTWESGDYVVLTGDVTINGHITVNETVNLTLTTGTTLTANKGITLSNGATLTVSGEGAMVVNGSNNNTSSTVAGTGTLVLKSGTLTAKGGNGQNGSRRMTGSNGGVAINGSVTVNDGNLTATGGNGGGINETYVANGGVGGAAINGSVTINGGNLTATGGTGGGLSGYCMDSHGGAGGTTITGNLTINGGKLTTKDGNAGSGSGEGCSVGAGGKGYSGTLTLGAGVKLYEGTDNTGTVLYDNDNSDSRVYEGEKKANMYAELLTGPDKTALNNAITAAVTLYDSIKNNNDYTDIARTLNAAIDAAKGVAESDEAEQDAVDTATTAITTAKTNAELALAKLEAKAEVDKLLEGKVEEEYDADDWKAMNKAITDAEAAIDAVTDISKISEAKETAINATKAVIDATKTKAEKLAAAKTEATTELDDLLNGKKQEDYDAEDWSAINTAIANGKTAIERATDVAGVTSAKETATNTVATIKTIAEKELEAAKQEATAELDALLDGKKEADYDAEDWTAIQDAITTAKNNIAKATTKDAVDNAKQTAKETVGTKKTKTEKLADAKTEAKAALDKLLTEKKQSDYDEAEWDALTQAVADGKDLIDNATDIAGVNTAKTEVETSVGEIKTKAQKLADAKETAKKALDELLKGKSANDYDEAEWKALNDAIEAGKKAIDEAANEAEVNKAQSDATTKVEEVKTKADKALDAVKEAAKAELNALLSDENKAKYDAEEWKAVEEAVKAGIDSIDKAKNAEEIKAATEAAKTAVDAVKTIAEKAAEKDAADKVAADKVIEVINKLPASDKVTTTDKAAIEAARKAYTDLTPEQKEKVSAETLKKLEAAEKALADAEKKESDDTDAAKKVTDAISALPATDKVATTDKAAIEAARKAYDALTADQKKKVPADVLKKLTDAENALKAAEKKVAEDAANAAAAKKVVDAINKLPVASKVTVPNKAAIEAARKAYNSLTAEQKKNVPADVLKKLTDDEKALAAAEVAEKAAKELEAAKEEAQAAMNEQVTVTQKGKKFTVKWKKSSVADGYYVYASYCGKKATKPAKTITKNTTIKTTITKINGKKISAKKNFKVFVAPYKIIDGKKVKLGESIRAKLVGTKNTKYSNVKKLTLKKSKYTVKVGKTAKIKASVTLVNKNRKHLPKKYAAKFRYKSSDTSIATVDKNGKIKGIKKGTCTIYVYSINGLMKKAQITVK